MTNFSFPRRMSILSVTRRTRLMAGTAIVSLLSGFASAQTVNIGATNSTGVVTVTFASAVTLNATLGTAIQVVTQGAPNLDFQYRTGGTCAAGGSYARPPRPTFQASGRDPKR